MTLYITDTHALLWYLGGSSLLSVAARNAFDETARGVSEVRVPAIVLAELVMLAEKRRIEINVNTIVDKLRAASGFRLISLSPEVAIRIQSLNTLGDIHDRLIVADALEANATVITRDQAITSSNLVSVKW